MIAVALALAAACAYGVSDFLSGTASRRVHYGTIALMVQAVMTVATWIVIWFVPGVLSSAVIGWGLLSGVGASLGTVMLYRGLGRGRMNVVAPLSAATAAVVPVAFGLLAGERPAWLTLAGIALIVPAIWLISSTETQPGQDRAAATGAADGALAGLAFAVSYIALDQAPSGSGLWAAAFTQLSALVVIAVAATMIISFTAAPVDRLAGHPSAMLAAGVSGLLGAGAVATFLVATEHGMLVVVSVLTSLYPAVTVLLATVLLHERTSRQQVIGMLAALGGVVLVTVG